MKPRVALIFKNDMRYFSEGFRGSCTYHFLFSAGKRSQDIEMNYVCCDDIDLLNLKDFDAIIFPDILSTGCPRFTNFDKIKSKKLFMNGDCHDVITLDSNGVFKLDIIKLYKWDYFFYVHPVDYFYKFYPKEYKYRQILTGIEKRLYENIDFNNRIDTVILNTGALNINHYKLRSACNKSKYVQYVNDDRFYGDNYPLLIKQFKASIASCDSYSVGKHYELTGGGA